MKVDRSKLKKSSSEVPADCKILIDKLKGLSDDDLYRELTDIKAWNYGKCELYHWTDVLDVFDTILEKSCSKESEKKWTLHSDLAGSEQLKRLLLEVLRFTALLIEHSFSRHLYSSMDHLTTLLTSCDMSIVLYVLNLLYVFSKRSNFISRMNPEKKQGLIQRLIHLAESWGGKENGFGLAECCQDLPIRSFPLSATTLHFEFYTESKDSKNKKSPGSNTVIQSIHMENVDKTGRMPSQIMEDILEVYDVPEEKQVLLFTHIRLACLFSNYEARVHCVQARLQAISILVYSSAIQDNMNVILYPGLIEELVDIVEIKDSDIVDIKSAALRTLTSVIHIERNPRLNSIIDATGASSYHGFLPVLVRTCIQHMIDPDLKPFPQTYATSLFSFLYHLASYENGVEALVSCGMMESLLKIINWYGDGQEHITFVTRAVRVIDLITNMDMAAFQANGGLQAFINRLEHEVNICRKEQPFVIRPHGQETSMDALPDSPLSVPMDTSQTEEAVEGEPTSGSYERGVAPAINNNITTVTATVHVSADPASSSVAVAGCSKSADDTGAINNVKVLGKHCFAQRAALLKSMLNFMKKAIPDISFADSIRHLMDGSLPKSLKHIISNAEYYGPSLFLLATDVVTVYVFQEPSLLSSLQDKGLTDVVLYALLIKDVPATREVLASLPNVFSALCLNARGLEAFVACKPFDRLFKVLLSPDYLPAMRRRRSSDPFGDTASNLGNAMDELMRHQPSLRTDATKAIIKLLEEICSMGQDPHFICQKQQPKSDQAAAQSSSVRSPQSNEASSSDEEEDEEVEMPHMPASITASTHINTQQAKPQVSSTSQQDTTEVPERQAIPLMDYVLNVMKFVEAILSNNSTDDHCREFVAQKGLKPLMSILGLPNLPIDFPSSPACQAVSSVCKSVLTLSRESEVMKQGLLQMHEVLQRLDPLHRPLDPPGGSVLLHELANCAHIPDSTLSPTATPLLHALAAVHAYIMMFVHVCRMGQTDIRTISVNSWGSDLGLEVLKGLSSLYNSLVWESTVLLALCNEDYLPADCLFGRADLEKLQNKDAREKGESGEGETGKGADDKTNVSGKQTEVNMLTRAAGEMGSNGVSVAMETLTTCEEGMDTTEPASHISPSLGFEAVIGQHGTQASSMEETGRSLVPPLSTVVMTSASSSSIESDVLPMRLGAGTTDDKDVKKKVSPAMQAQLRQLKPLLTLSSRLGRALSELFALLVKLCVGSPVRQRRSQQPPPTPPVPSPQARAVALALTKLLAGGLSFQPPVCAPQPKLRLTFLVCAAGFTAPMLFDEKKQPYHLLLHKFVACGGQAALFQSFSWALSIDGKVPLSEGLEYPELPEGTGEFLDSWLTLVEKMANPKAVLESPHTLPPKSRAPSLTPFNPVQYLISTQKAAFNAVMNLWNKKPLSVHGSRMSESVLAILCHIIGGEEYIRKQLEKDKSSTAGGVSGDTAVDLSGAGPSNQSTATTAPSAAGTAVLTSRRPLEYMVNQAHLQQLVDMGFTVEQATVALNNTSSLEQATDYILTNPFPPPAQNSLAGSMDLEMNDDDQMMRAIAMSLGESDVLSTDQTKGKSKDDKIDDEIDEKQEAEEPLDASILDDFTRNIFPGCLNLLDILPETVYRVCDLLIVVMNRNGAEWKEETLGTLCRDLCELCEEMTLYAQEMNIKAMQYSTSAKKFATRLHLLSLLAEEMNRVCALAMHQEKLPARIVNLLQVSRDSFLCPGQVSDARQTPRWLAPMLLLLDLWEKISVALKRKMQAKIAVGPNRIWKWFDDSSGRWCKYSTHNNTTIDEAYSKGESYVRFQAGRRKYSVQFGTMIQLNEETGNRRPVMLAIPTAEEKPPGKKDSKETNETFAEEIRREFSMLTSVDGYLPGLPHESIETVISCLSSFLSIPLNSDALHAAMRLILRLTRQHQYAVKFVEEGGAQRLLMLTLDSSFQGFLNLATLIFRHILEEPVSLRYCMEKVMRNVCAGIGSCQSGVSQGGVGAREMHYVLRVLGPAACRDPELFSQVARDTLQIALPPPSVRDEDEARYVGPNAPQILKCTPTKQLESLVNPSIKTFIWDLLNALVAEQPNKSSKDSASQTKIPHTLTDFLQEAVTEAGGVPAGSSNHFSWVIQCGTGSNSHSAVETDQLIMEKEAVTTVTDESNAASSRPLIPKSAILRLLSEIIRSYGNCVQLITQHYYQPGQTELVRDGCSVLAFVLDSLLPNSQEVGDKDCPPLARVFIASIASCSHSPDAQMALVTEVKAALQRALALPEGSSKHQRLQALATIIDIMIESCPTPGQIPNQVFKGQQVINNNMMKILVKKGMLVDLARIPHNLDLSSPFLASTINAVLKPLETLSRSVNSPDKFVSMKKSGADHHGTAPDQGGTTMQVVTEPSIANDEGNGDSLVQSGINEMNVTIEDVTHDLGAQANLEMSSEHQITEPNIESQAEELDSVLTQILQTEAGGDPEEQVVSEMTISQEPTVGDEDNEILIDVEVEGDDDDYEAHDSQMVTQVLSDEDDEADDHRDHDNQDDVSADEDYDEADQEEIGEDDEEDDEEDEDDDDEDASDIDGDGDDYQEIRPPFDSDDMIFHMEDFPSGGGGQHIIFNDTSQIQTYQLPVQLHDSDTGNDALPSMPPPPSNITSTHPLLMRQGDPHSMRVHRGGRQRMRALPTVHVNLNPATRQPNTPVILQRPVSSTVNERLLGPSTAAEILQLTSSLSTQNSGGTGPTRVVLAGDNLNLIQRPEDDLFDELFQDPYTETGSTGTGALSCVPSTLTRWTEETKALDGDGVHDLVTILKPPLIEELVKKREQELAERKEKRKKNTETVASTDDKKENQNEAKPANSNSSLQSIVTAPLLSVAPAAPISNVGTSSTNHAAEIIASAIVEEELSPLLASAVTASSYPAPVTVVSALSGAARSRSLPASVVVTSMDLSATAGSVMSSSLSGLSVPPSEEGNNTSQFLAFQTHQSSLSSHPGTITCQVVPPVPAPTTSNIGSFTSFQQIELMPTNSVSSGSVGPSPLMFADIPSLTNSSVPPPSLPAFTSPFPNLFHTIPSQPPSATSTPLQPLDNPPIGLSETWATSLPSAVRDNQRPTQNTAQNSMISQLLDSFMSDQPFSTGSTTSSIFPHVAVANTALPSGTQSSLPASRHIPWQHDSHFTVPPPNFYHSSLEDTTVTTGASNVRPDSSYAFSAPVQVSASINMASSRPSSCLYELSAMPDSRPQPPAISAPQYRSLDLAQDLSSIFSQANQPFFSSRGVTGATPPMSNLTFVATVPSTTSAISGPSVEAISSSSSGTTVAVGGTSGTETQQPRGVSSNDPEIPEGVDPSFLAALPEHIRQEVISEQLRLQRIRRRAQEQAQQSVTTADSSEGSTAMEVNPEFLAALPPAIQEEVLAQQRAEQARLVAQQQNVTNPDMPVDPATFFSTLSTSLRQQVLSDMDDSMLAVLPPELAAEAQELRRDMEERHRRLLQERLFAQAGAASISAILRHSGLAGRLGTRYAIRATQRQHNQWSFGSNRLSSGPSGTANPTKVKGRFMLDPEALTCLLVLLFIDEPKLNTTRLHRVLRNLCYHGPTRAWLIRALLSIVQRAGDSNVPSSVTNSVCVEGAGSQGLKDKGKGKKSVVSAASGQASSTISVSSSVTSMDTPLSMHSDSSLATAPSMPQSSHEMQPMVAGAATQWTASNSGYWLSISLEAALGCRANVFQIHRTSGKKMSSSSAASICVHPQAAPLVCRHSLDTLISLAKVFPTYFLPAAKVKEVNRCDGALKDDDVLEATKRSAIGSTATANLHASALQSSPKPVRTADVSGSGQWPTRHESKPENDFWNILVRLDSASGKSKGKSVQRNHNTTASELEMFATDYTSSPLGQLMSMLNHPVVRRSQLLTDRLLRLLGLVSVSLSDNSRQTSTTTATTTTTTSTARSTTTVTTAPTAALTVVTTAATTTSTVRAQPATTTSTIAAPVATQDGEVVITHESKKKDAAVVDSEAEEDEVPVLYDQLKLAVDVLTSKSCSEEGLEDATNLLLQLSWANAATRAAVLELLLSGARQLGMTVCSHITSLLEQLKELNVRLGVDQMEDENTADITGGASSSGASQSTKGILQDRFASGASIVVSAPAKLKTGRELQLPSMSQLTSKTSGQHFFLRILKVIIQLRDAARNAGSKSKKPTGRGRSGIEQIHAILNSVVSDDEFLNLFGDNQMLHEVPAASAANPAQTARTTSSTPTNMSGQDTVTSSQSQASQAQAQGESTSGSEIHMEVDAQANPAGLAAEKSDEKASGASSSSAYVSGLATLPRLSEQLGLNDLWTALGDCLAELALTPDHHAVLILQPAVEAFFIVHAGEKGSKPSEQPVSRREDQLAHLNMEMAPPSPSPGPSSAEGPPLMARENSSIAMSSITHLPPDTQKFLKFAETHRTVLNQILRQSTLPLAEGPFSVLVDYTRILDFDVKRRYFRQELERMNEGTRREDLPVHVRRSNVFEDSFRELFRRTPEEWKQRFYIVFEGEEGQDAGGLLREWYIIISHEIFNQNYALFLTSPGDRVTYSINPSSHCNSNHLSYFKFVGRIIAKAVYDNKLLDCYFTRSFYKHMLGQPVKYTDMESEDYTFYQGLVFLLENNVADLGYDIYFSTEIQEFGVTETRELIPYGANVLVTDENKREYVKLVCQMKMRGAIRQQLNAFLEGFYDIIPKKLVSIFTEQELELLISGLPTIDIDDLKANTEYHKYQATSLQIQWFWRALRSFDQAERANFLQFVTGTSKVPLGGFANLEGMNGTQKFQIHRDDRSTDRLPSAHTCFNQLDLPAYETYDKLRKMLLLAISECSEGFGLA